MATKFDGYIVLDEHGELVFDKRGSDNWEVYLFDTLEQAEDAAEQHDQEYGVSELTLLGFHHLPWPSRGVGNG
jgi:hypothetical protein